jgi:hypothetical protein
MITRGSVRSRDAVLLSARAVEFLPGGAVGRAEQALRDGPLPWTIQRLRAAGTPEGYIEWRMAMLGGIRRGDDAYLSDGVQQVLGRPAPGLAAWAARGTGRTLGSRGRRGR